LIALTLAFALGWSAPAFAQQALLVLDSVVWGDAWNSELAAAGISYTTINSSALAGTDLTQYEMVVTASAQSSTYNQRINDKQSDFEDFIVQGGVLLFSGATQSGYTPYPLPPFGGANEYQGESYNDVADATHPIMSGVGDPIYGTSASHDYFPAPPAGAQILTTGQVTGEAVTYVLHRGAGAMVVTGLTWEHGWNYGYEHGTVLINAIDWGWNFEAEALLVQDAVAWSGDAWNDELTAAGISYTQIGSADFASVDLYQYRMIVTVSVQGSTYNTRLNARQGDLEAYIAAGGVVLWSGCTQSGETPYPTPLFGGTNNYGTSSYNDVEDPSHPIMAGVGDPMYGTSASHNYFTGLPGNEDVLATHQGNGYPTLYVIETGAGAVVATGLTWEHGWYYGYDAGTVLVNAIDWGWGHGGAAACADADGDGYEDEACGGTDCDDADAGINPGAAEAHDGVDQDCDDLVDEGALPSDAMIITEIMKNPSMVLDSYGEWFEVFNNTAVPMDLYGLVVTDDGSNSFTVDASVPVPAYDYAVFVKNDDFGANGGVAGDYMWLSTFDLSNTEDEIILTHDGTEMDRVEYADPDWPDVSGAAMSLDINSYDINLNDDFASWCDAEDAYGDGDLGTPGVDNPQCCPDADGDGYFDDACGGDDCDDADAAVNPGAAEAACDYVDNDCDGTLHPEETDNDGDGFDDCQGDCDDTDAAVFPGAPEVPCDYIDNDCDGGLHPDAIDDDGDGFDECQGDCEDGDPAVNPGAHEVPCDLIDNDCDGVFHPEEVDDDGDGFTECEGDCDDSEPTMNPGLGELPCDGLDNDCDGMVHPDEQDDDGDGFTECDGDCDDNDAALNPAANENPCDGLDTDCDGILHPDEVDDDADGLTECDGDCDDADADIYPGADEWCDGVDNDCDGDIDEEDAVDADVWYEDLDGDSFGNDAVAEISCNYVPGFTPDGGDCDDTDPNVFPGAPEAHDAIDNDCDGFYDEGVLPYDALVITEIMQNPAIVLDDVGEWFEVLNNTAVDMNLIGLDAYDLGSNLFTVDSDLWIAPGEYAVFGVTDDYLNNGGVPVDHVWPDFNLGNGDDEIVLEHDGLVLDEVAWDGGILWIDPNGASMSLDPSAYDPAANDDPESWCEGSVAYGDGDLGTPGDLNTTCCEDLDGDGFADVACGGDDCDDTNADINPAALEECDGIDNDCDPATDELVDLDGDGFALCDGDCDEYDIDVFPGADEICDGIDNDCDAATDELVDGDGDTFSICDGDCDDADATVYPGATEICDGLDNDCDGMLGVDEVDEDGDGVLLCEGDCDDLDATTYPDAPELCDGIDNDCDGTIDEDTDADLDGDGFNACQGDCDDNNADTYPGAVEICDGFDNDCDEVLPEGEVDEDGDGWLVCEDDCDDTDAALNLDDADGDGVTSCDGDCDDDNADTYPGAEEICDGEDNNCDGVGDDVDDDMDGYMPVECGGEDCDDTDADVHPGAFEDCEDGIDNDCDGDVDGDDEECGDIGDDDDSAPGDDDDDDDSGDDDCECDASGSGSKSSAIVALLLALGLIRRRI